MVTLTSDDETEATVPATVTISAEQASATFTITAQDDTLFDGTQTAGIGATAAGYATPPKAMIQVTNDEVLVVLALAPTTTGFVAQFNQQIDASVSSLDTAKVSREVVGLNAPEIAPLPSPPLSIVQRGQADPDPGADERG